MTQPTELDLPRALNVIEALRAEVDRLRSERDEPAIIEVRSDGQIIEEPPPDNLHERLAQYEPMVNQMMRDIREARDARGALEAELAKVHHERAVAIDMLIPQPEANEPTIVAAREAAREPTLHLVKQMAELFDRNTAAEEILEAERAEHAELVAEHERLLASSALADSHIQSALDEKRASDAKLEPARRVVEAARALCDSDNPEFRTLCSLIKAYDQAS